MEKPYRYLKKLVKVGNSFYVVVPANWLNKHKVDFRKMKVYAVVLEVYDDKLVISLPKQKMDKEIEKMKDDIMEKVDLLNQAINARFDKLKKVIGDFLELSSSIALASVKTSLKNV